MASQTSAGWLFGSLALMVLAGCSKQSSEASQTSTTPAATIARSEPAAAPATPPLALERRTALVAAAERFENLTEAAFSSNPAEVAKRTATAKSAAGSVREGMNADQGSAFDSALGKIGLAAQGNSPVDLSLASNEGYRAVLSEAGGEPKIPFDNGLLDYAGFRIVADARDPTPRWDDVREALGFASQRWNAVKPLIANAKAKDDFDKALVWIQEALVAKDARSLERAATREFDLVDVLETAVKPK